MVCFQFLLNSLDSVATTLCALKNNGKNAVLVSLKLVLLAMNGLDDSKKKEELQHVIPFIKNWAIVNIGEKFSSENEMNIQREYQVHLCNRFDAYQIEI